MSRAALRGSSLSRRDDLEQLLYCLHFMITQKLPWLSLGAKASSKDVLKAKESATLVADLAREVAAPSYSLLATYIINL